MVAVFGCERFHQYIYAKEVIVETDHRSLVSIISKPLDKAQARLQRMLLKLQRYNINLHCKPGKELYIVDTHSRVTSTQHRQEGRRTCTVCTPGDSVPTSE